MGSSRFWASVTTLDLGQLVDVAQALQEAGVDGMHVDVSDGVFTPDLTFGYRVVRALTSRLSIPVEAHLMVVNPEEQLRAVGDAGASRASFHFESTGYPWRVVCLARSLGISVGIAFNPATPVGSGEYLREEINFVNILTSEPDNFGERMLPRMSRRVAEARVCLGTECVIQVDGGVSATNIAALSEAGAREFVVGRALLDQEAFPAALIALRERADGDRNRDSAGYRAKTSG
jgi:ribulose-phosphate 3-epimerase